MDRDTSWPSKCLVWFQSCTHNGLTVDCNPLVEVLAFRQSDGQSQVSTAERLHRVLHQLKLVRTFGNVLLRFECFVATTATVAHDTTTQARYANNLLITVPTMHCKHVWGAFKIVAPGLYTRNRFCLALYDVINDKTSHPLQLMQAQEKYVLLLYRLWSFHPVAKLIECHPLYVYLLLYLQTCACFVINRIHATHVYTSTRSYLHQAVTTVECARMHTQIHTLPKYHKNEHIQAWAHKIFIFRTEKIWNFRTFFRTSESQKTCFFCHFRRI